MVVLWLSETEGQVFIQQFNNSNGILGFPYGNLTGIKVTDRLRKAKSEMKSESRFSDSYMEDVAAIQQYFLYLHPGPPMSDYVQ